MPSSLARSRCARLAVRIEPLKHIEGIAHEHVREFLRRSRGIADGWLAHFWSLTPEELEGATEIADVLMRDSLDVFQRLDPNR